MVNVKQIMFIVSLIIMCSFSSEGKVSMRKKQYADSKCCCEVFTKKGTKEMEWEKFNNECDYHGCVKPKEKCSSKVKPLSDRDNREKFRDNIYIGIPNTKPCCCTVKAGFFEYKVHWTIKNNQVCNFIGCRDNSKLSDENCLELVKTDYTAVWNNLLDQ
jgi:hypothetical protein